MKKNGSPQTFKFPHHKFVLILKEASLNDTLMLTLCVFPQWALSDHPCGYLLYLPFLSILISIINATFQIISAWCWGLFFKNDCMRPKSPPLHSKLIIDGLMCPRKGMSKFFLCLVGVYKRQVRPLDVSGFYVSRDVK